MFPVRVWFTLRMKPMQGAPSTVGLHVVHTVCSDSAPADTLQLLACKRKAIARLSNEAEAV